MNYLSIDIIIVCTFLLLTLLIGLWIGRNVQNIKEYAIANRAYGVGILTMTILATFIAATQAIDYVEYVFDDGMVPVISTILCQSIISFLLIARFVTPKIFYFEECLTSAEIMGKLYGNIARICSGLMGALYCLSFVILQIMLIGHIGEFIHIPRQWAIALGGSFLVIYSARGGMKSIVITDVIHFVIITILTSLMANVLIHKLGGIGSVFDKLPSNTFKIFHNTSWKCYLVHCLWAIFPSFLVIFPFTQRMLMAKDKRQLAKSQYIGVFYLIAFYLLLTLVGLATIALKTIGDKNAPQKGSEVFVYLFGDGFPLCVKGIISIAMLAAIISIANSFLHSAGILAAHDVLKPLLAKKKYTINELKLSQYTTFCLGLVALCIALMYGLLPYIIQHTCMDLGKIINISTEFIAIVLTIPFIAGIMGLKTCAKSFFIPLIITFISFLFGKLLVPELLFIPFTILMNAISFFGNHYIQYKGFVTVKREINSLA